MVAIRRSLRRRPGWSHQWLGLTAGIAFSVLAFTGGIVTFRPQITGALSPAVPSGSTCIPLDWNQAELDVASYAHSPINRIYAPLAPNRRYHFRVAGDGDSIYRHVIYDACTGRVLGTANLGWMDWLVDFHHNFRGGKAGRIWVGWAGAVLLFSGVTGILVWLLARPSLLRLLRLRPGMAMPRDLHSGFGVLASALLLIASFTGLWLCFPQSMRTLARLPEETRAPRALCPPKAARNARVALAGLGDVMTAAPHAIPDGTIREVRLPDGYGSVQVRIWRVGDFRSLGNNVVAVDRATASVLSTDLYANRPPANRFVQAMAGLHYGEWGGSPVRWTYGIAGLASGVLFVTGVLMWWLPRRRASAATARLAPQLATVNEA
jgi:uncharacterized iron-regulated membrane protein